MARMRIVNWVKLQVSNEEGLLDPGVVSVGIILLGLLAVLGYAFGAAWITGSAAIFFSVGGVGVIVAGAALLGGALIGFLFGIPRTMQHDQTSTGHDHDESSVQEVLYRANTNLEQISDWLTKILVGVGLTQLTALPTKFKEFADYLAAGLGGASEPIGMATASSFAAGLMLYHAIFGFLLGYLLTRLVLAGALRRADVKALEDQMEKMAGQLGEQVKFGQMRELLSTIDPRTTETDEVLTTLSTLVDMDAVLPAINVGKTYLRESQFEKSKTIFEFLQEKVDPKHPQFRKVLSNMAYSEIGLAHYQHATEMLSDLEKLKKGKYFRAWHAIAMAYAYFMLDNPDKTLTATKYPEKFRHYLAMAKARKTEFNPNRNFYTRLYPEINEYIFRDPEWNGTPESEK